MLDRITFKKQRTNSEAIGEENAESVPAHVAIIMDGSGRWAKQKGLPRIAGHREGTNTVKKIVREANRLGVKTLTLYAFSTENWKRPKKEVEFLMKLPGQFLSSYLQELIEENVQVRTMGSTRELPGYTKKAVEQAISDTADNDGMILNFALNYGGRHEITGAVKRIAEAVKEGKLSPEDISEETIHGHLLSSQLSDPDLLIRTSGEIRLSNFMLWQLAYTELWFTEVYWPDFSEQHLREAVGHFSKRDRRFGGVIT